jgi:outer membrane protein assembly factor BamB
VRALPPIAVALALSGALVAVAASAGAAPAPVVVERPPFAGPPGPVPTDGRPGFELVSSRTVDPATGPPRAAAPSWAPSRFRGADLVTWASQPGTTFLGYGDHGGLTRWLVAHGPRRGTKWVLDVSSLGRSSWPLELRFARQVGGTLYVANAHRTYAATTRNRNGYVTALDPATGRIRWQSPALVANADRFAVVGDVLVTGYGFTAEADWLYALDRRTGKPLARLAVPSAPEVISARGRTLTVRTYDHRLVVRLRG